MRIQRSLTSGLPRTNVKAKHGTVDDDVYNFDETGFMMGIIFAGMVVPAIPPFIILAAQYHLANWCSVLAWHCRLFGCRGVTTSSAVGNESGPSGMMTVWPPASMIWSIQASTVAFSADCKCVWAKKMVGTVSRCCGVKFE